MIISSAQAYSRVKKCNNEGRAQMSLDWQTLHSALLKLSAVKYVALHAHVLTSTQTKPVVRRDLHQGLL